MVDDPVTRMRTPDKVKRKETEAMNMRRRGRSGMVARMRNPSRVSCSSTSSTMTTRLAKASSNSAPVPGIPIETLPRCNSQRKFEEKS
jgi:hypothetical protein